jgi:hypothetical protein
MYATYSQTSMKAYDSFKREVLYNIPTEFRILMKQVMLNNISLNQTYSKILTGKHLSDTFHISYWNSMGHIDFWSMPMM